jgi:hypothetical protein
MVRYLSEKNITFENAVAKFQEFLKANQYSGEIVWVQPGDVLLTDKRLVYVRVSSQKAREKMARKTYEEGMPRRRGVLFRTICDLGRTTCSHVWAPGSDDDAERLLMPIGLKLSVQTDRIRGVPVKSGIWWAYLRVRYRRKQVLKVELFR